MASANNSLLHDSDKPNTIISKRSARRRSKDNGESVLQNAIARKQKMYNEDIVPQRLSKQTNNEKKMYTAETANENSPKSGDDLPVGRLKIPSNTSNSLNRIGNIKRRSPRKYVSRIQKNDVSVSSNKKHEENTISSIVVDFQDSINVDEAEDTVSYLCACTDTSRFYGISKGNETMFCAAVDSIDDKLLGCSRTVDNKKCPMLRPSKRVPYGVLCDLHRNRLIRHNCCSTCGLFCTQGRFFQCQSKHQYHRNCQLSSGDSKCCPHCGLPSSTSSEIVINMYCDKNPIFLSSQESFK